MRVLVIGATGMLGYSLFSNLSEHNTLTVFGTVRSVSGKEKYFYGLRNRLIEGVDVENVSSLEDAFNISNPDVVINCVGIIKQQDISKQHIASIKINSLLPHILAELCDKYKARLIHFSTDCIFDGAKGHYKESDLPTARDLYGKSKYLGEVDYGNHITLRTSIIGHELDSSVSLVDWFLSQSGQVKGYSQAIFSGLPTCYVAKVLLEKVITNSSLRGVYNLSVEPIDKYTLLSLISAAYNKSTTIVESKEVTIDRSLNSDNFRSKVGFTPASWPELIDYMNIDYRKRYIS
ncbi:dTDP-4-dehydrorhamnose reductase family protein [Enterovibrio sp. 27052020O]|uniref:dTDP-4-dehydrorhamnose reductase family protein n=1 Tax=Enterovibrio sp. 27052020O TaxID=3241166 RepID=UPI00388FBB16